MKPFTLESDMKNMGGVFYPTGYMILMLPSEQAARDAGQLLADGGFSDDDVALITPQDFRRQIAGAAGDENILPSAGTEGDTVRRFVELADEGHHGVMIHVPHGEDADRAVAILKDAPISYGQKYRRLVIEDIVE
ncbi:MAG: RNA-binding protein [Comamonadaceae bacterium]|nr:MAG: RNA-binding protein [Comamonadaceae bacterium]